VHADTRAGSANISDVPGWAVPLVCSCRAAGEDIDCALDLADRYGRLLPLPGHGQTARRWAVLAAVAEQNLTVARVLEAHSDALAILAEAGAPAPSGTWGVFAAEAQPHRLTATESAQDGQVNLTGVKPWCSLAGQLDCALVTAHGPGGRQLYRVSLREPTVTVDPPGGWVARGLRTVTSVAVRFDGTLAQPVGEPGWYLSRPGFAWGGIGVAACWLGGAAGLRTAIAAAAAKRNSDLTAMLLGETDVALWACQAALRRAARLIDSGTARGSAGELLGLRLRALVAGTAEQALKNAGHALGPAPLAFDEEHARRTADLALYIRQHHAERDLARLGSMLTQPAEPAETA
jgi:alkylation response protein AidB-like acyl-CoA dehydrogenase